MKTTIRVICFTLLLSAFPFRAAAEDFTNAIHAYLRQYIEARKIDGCIVVGIVDEHGSSMATQYSQSILRQADLPSCCCKTWLNAGR